MNRNFVDRPSRGGARPLPVHNLPVLNRPLCLAPLLLAALLLPLALLTSTPVQAQTAAGTLPLYKAIDTMDVQDQAKKQAETNGALAPNAPATVPDYASYEGTITADSNDTRLALLSDDGCDMFITDQTAGGATQKVVSKKGVGQAMPDLANSLVWIPTPLIQGHAYLIHIDYSNICYTGKDDLDGVTLFQYEAVPVADAGKFDVKDDTSTSVPVSATSPSGGALTFSIVDSPGHGTISGSGPNWTYTPATHYLGSDSFSFKANDGAADSNTATVSLNVQFAGSYNINWNDSNPVVAAGAIATPAHQEGFTVSVKDAQSAPWPNYAVPPVEILSGGTGSGTNVTASATAAASTDSSGQSAGTFTSGNTVEGTSIGIRKTPGDPTSATLASASIPQVWSDLCASDSWSYNSTVDFNTPSPVTAKLAYLRGGAEVPIAGHAVTLISTSISGYEWDPTAGDLDDDGNPMGDYNYNSYSATDLDHTGWNEWNYLASWDGTVDNGDGSYSSQLTISYDEDFVMDDVNFDLLDGSVYFNQDG